jgi:hypothetical protein
MSSTSRTPVTVAAPGVSRASGMLAWVRRFWSRFQPSQRTRRSILRSALHILPCDEHPGRSRPRVARAVHQAARCNGAQLPELTETVDDIQPAISGFPWWDVEQRCLDELLANTARAVNTVAMAQRAPGALVCEVAQLAQARGRTLDAVVSEALQQWAWREQSALLERSGGSEQSTIIAGSASFAAHRHCDEQVNAARRRDWGEIEATLSALRVS